MPKEKPELRQRGVGRPKRHSSRCIWRDGGSGKSEEIEKVLKSEAIDVSLYGTLAQKGALHPVMETMDKIIDYFVALNFAVSASGLLSRKLSRQQLSEKKE